MSTRSEIEGWKTDHLTDAAARWRVAADNADKLFDQHRNDVSSADWSGSARDAATDRVTADVGVAQQQGQVQREAAQLAEDGHHDIQAAKRDSLTAIGDAEADGFRVSEELLVRDARRYDITTIMARNQAAKVHADSIQSCAERLIQTDSLVGQRLQDKAAELGGIRFGDSTIQAASWGDLKQDGADSDWEPPVIKTEAKPHEPTVIDASPDPMFPNCDTGDVWNNIGQVLGGTAVVAIGIAGVPLTLGGSLSAVIGGGATIVGGINGMRHCG